MEVLDRVAELLATRDVSMNDVLVVAEAGSTMHGVGVGDQDDLDLVVVRIEPFHELVHGPPRRQSMMIRTQPEGSRSGPGDIDVQCYGLRRFADLVTSGNPTLLNTVFLDTYFHLDQRMPFELLRTAIDRPRAGAAYLGYMSRQLEKWRNGLGTGRQELVEAFGFDTKYAYHAIRLGLQGAEFLTTGRISLPIQEPDRSELAKLRTGGYTEKAARRWADDVEGRLVRIVDGLPETGPSNIDDEITAIYRDWYRD